MKSLCLSLCLLLLYTSIVWAQEFAYVTDSLQLRVYAGPTTDSELLQSIDSGDSVEVFETQDGFSKVTTYDGTVGWVKSAFLVEDPPAKLLYYSVSEKNKQLEAEIETLKNTQTESDPAVSDVDSAQITELQAALDEQQKVNQNLQKQLEENKTAVVEGNVIASTSNTLREQSNGNQNLWLIGLGLSLIGGLLLGLKVSSWRMKKRLHGFRF